MTPLAAALRYRALGFNPLPIAPGAHEPLVKWKALQTTRTTDVEIREWYRRWPHAGVGIVCGEVSGLVVLDADPRNGPGLDLDYGNCPTVQTPGGGWHRYFAYTPCARSAHPLVPGLDVQSDRTYVIAPPSRRAGKVYTFVGNSARQLGQLPFVPLSIVELLAFYHAYAKTDRPLPSKGSHVQHADAHANRPGIRSFTDGVTLDEALRLLEVVGKVHLKKVGPLQWMAGCPLHDDRKPSLAISTGEAGRLLLHCFAGCSFSALLNWLAMSGNGQAYTYLSTCRSVDAPEVTP
jgi:hypothetical protein